MTSGHAKPVFIGGTLAEHRLFMIAMCRFQHRSVPLALVHYLTWSGVALGIHMLAFMAFGPRAPVVLAVALAAWGLRVDALAGVVFAALQVLYAWAVITSLRWSVPLAVIAIFASLLVEVASHHAFQGHGPRPPQDALRGISKAQKISFVPYFVFVFGIFFLTLDLAMRFLGYRPALQREVEAVTADWHRSESALRSLPKAAERSVSRET